MKKEFDFVGAFRPCDSAQPHPPHLVGSYSTVAYGRLDRFCPGVSGDEVSITVEKERHGSADTPARLKGYSIDWK